MNIFPFIYSVVWICLSLFVLICPIPILEKWQSNFLAILSIIGGCIGVGVALVQ